MDAEFNDKKSLRYQYIVTEPNNSEAKFFSVSKRTSEIIEAQLREGKNILKFYYSHTKPTYKSSEDRYRQRHKISDYPCLMNNPPRGGNRT
ncbi:MAG: hypothetical protein M3044_05025 [Thermoproteota archaeon]|nr:hypothetical protein [Thermoproteota archaeon]